jgi:hypothetical protein
MELWALYKARLRWSGMAWAAFVLLLACVPDNQLDFPVGQNYFPLRVGDYKIYQVTETEIRPYNIETQFTYEIKTIVTDSFPNADGKHSYIISRFKRAGNTANWEGLDTWAGRSNDREVVITEGNTPYLRISYPVESARTWNGNTYNSDETNEICQGAFVTSCDLYSFGGVNIPYATSSGLSFEKAIEVIENNDSDTFVRYDVRKTIYALNVGIVYREINIKKYCTQDDCYGKQLVEDGRVMVMELKEYGNE